MMLITTFFKGRRWKIVNHSRNSQTVPLPCERESLGGPSLAFSATHSFRGCEKNMDLVIERFRRQDAIPLPCKRSWRTIVDVLCDAFEAVEKMDLVIILSREAQSFRACGKDVCGQSSTIITFLSSPLAFSHNSSLRPSTHSPCG
jgi:hypothetical protein